MINIEFIKNGQHATAYSPFGGTNLYQAEQFARYLQQYTLANIVKVGATQVRVITGGQESTGDFGAVGLYAHLWFLDATGKNFGFKVHAPKASMFEDDNSVKESIGIAIAQRLSTVAGQTISYKEGWLCGSST